MSFEVGNYAYGYKDGYQQATKEIIKIIDKFPFADKISAAEIRKELKQKLKEK